MSAKTLIDKASKIVGNRNKLARAMGVNAGVVYDWETERRTCSPEDRARLAGFANEDAVQELVRATLEKTAGTVRGEQLKAVLGKWLHPTGEGLHGVAIAVVSGIFGMTLLDIPRCIKRASRNYFYG